MKKSTLRALGAILALALVLALVPAVFADGDAARSLQEKGYLKGYPDGSLGLDRTITRAEFAALVNRVEGNYRKAALSFPDVAEGSWYFNDVAKIVASGLMVGNADGTFNPAGEVSRYELAVVVARVAGEAEPTAKDRAAATRQEVVDALAENLDKLEGKGQPEGEVYALVNLPYDVFYAAEGATIDAVSSATNKTGNPALAAGSWHSAATAAVAEDGTITAAGAANGAKPEGVIWPVQVGLASLKALGGREITDESAVTVATLGRGQTSTTELTGADCLFEAPAYSWYLLSETPAQYMPMTVSGRKAAVSANVGETKALEGASVKDNTLLGHHTDVEFTLTGAEALADKTVHAAIFSTEEGTAAGQVHICNIWRGEYGWNQGEIAGLEEGRTIHKVRLYVKGAEGYEVYEAALRFPLKTMVKEGVTASFAGGELVLTGLPADARNVTASVYVVNGRTKEGYLTAEAGAPVVNGKVAVTAPAADTTYTVTLVSDNYAFKNVTVG